MASAQSPKGRGRTRTSSQSTCPPTPSIQSTPVDSSKSTTPSTTDIGRSDPGYATASTPQSSVSIGRGRGDQLQQKIVDPRWTVSTLSVHDFKSNARPFKRDELGTIGEEIRGMVNYFSILTLFKFLTYLFLVFATACYQRNVWSNVIE